MERYLLWGVTALGVLGWLSALFLPEPSARVDAQNRLQEDTETSDTRRQFNSLLLQGIGLSFLILLATLPNQAPFAAGGGFGRGFFAGGLAAMLAAWSLFRIGAAVKGERRAAVIFSVALIMAPLPLLFFRAQLVDLLCGIALGWFATTFLLVLAPVTRRYALPLTAGVGFAVTLCGVALLGTYRDPQTATLARGTWAATGLLLAAFVPFSLLATLTLPAVRWGRLPQNSLRYLLSLGLVLLVGGLLALKVVNEKKLLIDTLLGLSLGVLTWWVVRDVSLTTGIANRRFNPEFALGVPVLPLLLVTSAYMVAFQLLQGYGVAILLIGFFVTVAFAMPDAREPEASAHRAATLLLSLALFGVVLLLYRVYTSRWTNDLRGVTLVDHYALFGVIAGIALPRLLASYLRISNAQNGMKNRVVLLMVGVLALAVPGVIVVLWGGKCILALLIGLALSCLQSESDTSETGSDVKQNLSLFAPALLAIGIALVLVQLTGHLIPLAEMTRPAKQNLLVYASAIIVGLIGALSWSERQQTSTVKGEAER